ncbi:MAG TPA: ankyrin repeat domain-containing protein [Gemmataceae bacterium]|nr:ankyrin repeat domain-containing protein [Gemmataceae bacterium]
MKLTGVESNRRIVVLRLAILSAARGDRPEITKPSMTDHPEVVELLIKRGADINAKTASGPRRTVLGSPVRT